MSLLPEELSNSLLTLSVTNPPTRRGAYTLQLAPPFQDHYWSAEVYEGSGTQLLRPGMQRAGITSSERYLLE